MAPRKQQIYLISLAEAAQMLGVSRPSMYRLLADGCLPSYRIPHSRGTQVLASDVLGLLEASRDPDSPVTHGRRRR